MATFLTTPRMNPALRARVERAVSHRARAKHHAAKVGLGSPFAGRERLRLARVLPVLALLLVVGLGGAAYVLGRRTLEAQRTALLAALTERRAGLPTGHETFLPSIDRWVLESAADSTSPDLVDPSLKTPGALEALLSRPAVYIRGPEADLASSARLPDAAGASVKDAFLFCLTSPPPSTSERDLLTKVRGVYFGGAKVDEQTANIRRLTEAHTGLIVLAPTFEESVRKADDAPTLKRLLKDQAAPTDEAKKAATATLLIIVSDTPSPTGTREARVTFVDLTTRKVLVRAHPHIDSQARSPAATIHRDDIDSCHLAAAPPPHHPNGVTSRAATSLGLFDAGQSTRTVGQSESGGWTRCLTDLESTSVAAKRH